MEIYKYAINTKDWKNIVNSNLKGKQRQTAFDNYIKATGTKVTLQNYFDDDLQIIARIPVTHRLRH